MVVRHSSAGELALALDHMGGQGGPAAGARAATATISYRRSDGSLPNMHSTEDMTLILGGTGKTRIAMATQAPRSLLSRGGRRELARDRLPCRTRNRR
jgi:hypothetical protein